MTRLHPSSFQGVEKLKTWMFLKISQKNKIRKFHRPKREGLNWKNSPIWMDKCINWIGSLESINFSLPTIDDTTNTTSEAWSGKVKSGDSLKKVELSRVGCGDWSGWFWLTIDIQHHAAMADLENYILHQTDRQNRTGIHGHDLLEGK